MNSESSLAVTLADLVVSQYIVKQVLDTPTPEHTLLKAAQKCGCPTCVADYISMVDFITQGDKKWSNGILTSQGIKRPSLGRWEAQE